MFFTCQGACLVTVALSPDLSQWTHTSRSSPTARANEMVGWSCRGFWITLVQPRSSTAFSFHYWEKCLCGNNSLTMPSDTWICVFFLRVVSAATCMVSPAIDEGRGLRKFFPLQNLFYLSQKSSHYLQHCLRWKCVNLRRGSREKKVYSFRFMCWK